MKSITGLATQIFICFTLLTACTPEPEKPVTIAINPWPGYEFLYLAEKKGFFKQVGANVSLIQMASLADSQRAYINGYVDGLSSTIIEAVQAQPLGGKPLNIVMIPDYSDGGDVIIADKAIKNIQNLKGKRVGCEISSLGIYMLQRALAKNDMTLDDVTVVNIDQLDGEQAMLNRSIDAFISYPPVSVNILRHKQYHKIFDSSEIPFEIIDVVSISKDVLKEHPNLVPKLLNAWEMALQYSQNNKKETYALMAKREGIQPDEFEAVLSDLKLQSSDEQKRILSSPDSIQKSVKSVCKTLVHVDVINTNCDQYPDISYRGIL